jgi:hypothetical protein
MRRVSVLIVAAVSGLVAGSAMACSCELPTGPIENQVASAHWEADAVFSAEVVGASDIMIGFEGYQEAKLKVLKTWKGAYVAGSVVITMTRSECCLCGIKVKVGETLVVYLSGRKPYRLSECSRTRRMPSAAEDVRILDDLSKRKARHESPDAAQQRAAADVRNARG